MMKEQTVDTIGLTTGKAATFGGSLSAVLFGLSAYDVAAITGAVVAVVGLLVQWHYNRRRDRREERESQYRIAKYKRELELEAQALEGLISDLLPAEDSNGTPRI